MPADTKPIDLAGLRETIANMTTGEWRVEDASRKPPPHQPIGVIGDGRCVYIVADPVRKMPVFDACGIVAIVNAAGALLDRVEALEAGLREACEIALLAIAANEILPSTNSEAIERIHASLLPPEAPRAGEAANE